VDQFEILYSYLSERVQEFEADISITEVCLKETLNK
jgi:hypothetical protein